MSKQRCIILTGFMGTGKTTVGQALASRLGFQFIDTDILVEKDVGKTIPEIFKQEGEPSFRLYEKKMLKKALTQEKVVVATGGGAVIDPENLKLMKEKGLVVGLVASPEVILKRVSIVSKTAERPLLQESNRLKKIQELLSRRSPYYSQADHVIDTTSKALQETVEEILKVIR